VKIVEGRPSVINGRTVVGVIRKDFELTDFTGAAATIDVRNGVFNDLGFYEVKADEAREPGFGGGMMDSATARMYGVIMDDSVPAVEITGTFKFVITNGNDDHIIKLDEIETYVLNTNASDITKQIPYTASQVVVSEDRRIHLYFRPDGQPGVVQTIDCAASVLRIPGTRYNLQ